MPKAQTFVLPDSETAELLRRKDWATTSLGPVDQWPHSLRTAVDICLRAHLPSFIWWGPELLQIYNDEARSLLGADHPTVFGLPVHRIWIDAWEGIGVTVEQILGDRRRMVDRDVVARIEAFFSSGGTPVICSCSSLHDEAGQTGGMFITAVPHIPPHAGQAGRSGNDDLEAQHRVRNALAVVRSIVRRTAENSRTVDDMISHLQGRLDAYARVQSTLIRGEHCQTDLAMLVEDELIAHAAREGERLSIAGPDIRLPAKAAEAMSMALHELAANAVKFGALSASDGRIRIEWNLVKWGGVQQLAFSWTESGLDAPLHEPNQAGFGTELLRQSLPYELDAITELEFRREGVRFTLVMPLQDGIGAPVR